MRPRVTALGLVASLALAVAPVVSAGGSAVRIVLDVDFGTGSEVFTATGAFCPAGTAVSFRTTVTGGGANVFHLFGLTSPGAVDSSRRPGHRARLPPRRPSPGAP